MPSTRAFASRRLARAAARSRPGIRILLVVAAASAAGCRSSSVAREPGPSRACPIAWPATCEVSGDAAPSPSEPDLTSGVLVAMRASNNAFPPSLAVSSEPLWAEAPVVLDRAVEVNVGAALGFAFPGDQDLKFKRKDATGHLIDNLQTQDVEEVPPIVEALDVEAWRTRGFLADFGLRLSAIHWTTRVKAKSFVDGIPGGGTSPVPPFDTLDEERLGLFLSVERRFRISSDAVPASDAPYLCLGLGAGYVYSDVSHGASSWGAAAEAYAGFSLPVADRLRLQFEGHFLVTRDVDISGSNLEWEAETSGTRTGVPHAKHFSHLDTRFFAVMVGVEYRL